LYECFALVSGKEACNHTRNDENSDKYPDPFNDFFGIFVVEKTHMKLLFSGRIVPHAEVL
jgi:hypothetical protein